ncbi:MAG: hypothetical protein IJW33_01110 [Lentisphaeria bacterium]|nr:hypothetical protein [Lentisphaeria bacterium]
MKNISVQVSQHDKFQIELKFICPIKSGKKIGDYHIELYFFMPRNLEVTDSNFGTSQFYNDFYEHIRFQTPQFDLSALVSEESMPLKYLKQADSFRKNTYNKILKMFCSIAKSAMRDGEKAVESAHPLQRSELGKKYLRDTEKLLQEFRACRPESGTPENLELFDLVDEFLSINSNSYRYKLWEFFNIYDNQELTGLAAEVTAKELEYLKQRNYPSMPYENADNSELLYRESTLKKAMAGILFLNVETRRAGVFLENLLLGISAAVAMAFATAVSFIWKGLFLEEFSISFFIIWVIAYMFKDRIKSSLQLYCLSHRNRYSYDFRQKIRDGFGHEIGICREGFSYFNAKELDPAVTTARNRHTLSRLENGSLEENVMAFRKKIEIFGNPCRDIFQEFDVDGIVDIMRLNVRHWTYKMDNPSRIIHISDGKNIRQLKARRDYHVNMVIRYGERHGEDSLERYRIVLCRNGIRRLEKFNNNGELDS